MLGMGPISVMPVRERAVSFVDTVEKSVENPEPYSEAGSLLSSTSSSTAPESLIEDKPIQPSSENDPIELQRKYSPMPLSEMLGELVFAIIQLAVVVILAVVIYQVAVPLTWGFIVAIKIPQMIGTGLVTLSMVYGIYFFANRVFHHISSCWTAYQSTQQK